MAAEGTGNRFCEGCGYEHGPLYICEHYDVATKERILEMQKRHIANLQDREWIAKQMKNGVSLEGINIFRAFAGLPPLPPTVP